MHFKDKGKVILSKKCQLSMSIRVKPTCRWSPGGAECTLCTLSVHRDPGSSGNKIKLKISGRESKINK